MITKAAVVVSGTHEKVDDNYKLLSETLKRRNVNELRETLDEKNIFKLRKDNRTDPEEEWDTFPQSDSDENEPYSDDKDSDVQQNRRDQMSDQLSGGMLNNDKGMLETFDQGSD